MNFYWLALPDLEGKHIARLNIEELNTSDLRHLLKTIQRSVAQQLLTCKMKAHRNAPIEHNKITVICCPLPVFLYSPEFPIKADN